MQEGKFSYLCSLISNTVFGLLLGLLPVVNNPLAACSVQLNDRLQVDNFAHLGGFFCGIVAGLTFMSGKSNACNFRLLLMRPLRCTAVVDAESGRKKNFVFVKFGSLIVLCLMFVIGETAAALSHRLCITIGHCAAYPVLFHGIDGLNWCPNCTYIHCIPTPWSAISC